jgi:kumamolisin
MPKSKSTTPNTENYIRLEGSERRPSPGARFLGPADLKERFSVTLVLRRRPGGETVPDFDHFLKTPPSGRRRLSEGEFAEKYGASKKDLKKVTDFAIKHGLKIEESNVARRSVAVSGSAKQMSDAFAVKLGRYEHEVVRRRGDKPVTETYRGRDGFIHVPKDLAPILVGVFGLDNRRITKRNSADPSNTNTLSIETVTHLYNFPANSASGQTIAIFSEAGYLSSDINTNFGGTPPTLTDVTVDASNNGTPDGETTQDIVIAGKAAPGAAIAIYFTSYSQQGWVDLIGRVAHPNAGDPICSVLSSSFYVSNGDDSGTLANEGISSGWLTAATMAFQDAGIQGVTVCIATGDTGTDSKVGDGKAHVQYPASDPWVLAAGGTTVGNVSGSSFDEYVWNDTFFGGQAGATGGGISDFFTSTSIYANEFAYQAGAGVPTSLNDGHVGRGIPDVAANSSPNSGYPITVGGSPAVANGTSAAAPLWAGLIAVLNAAYGDNLGFVNPALYAIGEAGFRDIVGLPGPANNALNGVPGYPAGPGWDACTGWGSPNGIALLNSLKTIYNRPAPVALHSNVAARIPRGSRTIRE